MWTGTVKTSEHRISPAGKVRSKSGDFVVDGAAATAIIKAYRQHGTDLVVDVEHQTLGGRYASPDGSAPAVGWVRALRFDSARGLFARIEWNERGLNLIRSHQYRYLSPTIMVRKDDGRAVELHSVALTNKPAIARMDRLAASDALSARSVSTEILIMADTPTDAPALDPATLVGEIKSLLGIKVEDEADIVKVLVAIRDWAKNRDTGEESSDTMAASMRLALDLPADAPVQAITASMRTLKMMADTVPSHAERVLAPYIGKVLNNTDDERSVKDYADLQFLAASNPEMAVRILDQRMAMLPPNGRTTAPPLNGNGSSSRTTVAASASREFEAGKDELSKFTDKRAFVNMKLRDAGESLLNETESEQYA